MIENLLWSIKQKWQRFLCRFGKHTEGYPKGLINSFGSGFRVEYYNCKHCGKLVHWSVKVDY